nr:MAG TPA: hypothetical protein [Caudoviricetes sp.]
MGSNIFEYITESTAKFFNFELTVDGVPEPKSSVDEFGRLTLLKEDIPAELSGGGSMRILARSKENNKINSYIDISTYGINEPNPNIKYWIDTKCSNPVINGQTLLLI